jgi:hypothetical protein
VLVVGGTAAAAADGAGGLSLDFLSFFDLDFLSFFDLDFFSFFSFLAMIACYSLFFELQYFLIFEGDFEHQQKCT